MEYAFTAFGHPNITAKHRNTLEFTKEKEVTLQGDCIIGVSADFELEKIKEFIASRQSSGNLQATLHLQIKGQEITVKGTLNPHFSDNKELVLRRSDFVSERTLLLRCDVTAADLSSEMREHLTDPNQRIVSTLK